MAQNLTPLEYKLIKIAKTDLEYESANWCEHWLIGRLDIYERKNNIIPKTTSLEFYKAIEGLLKKKYIKMAYIDNYYLNLEATRLIKIT